MPVDESHSAKVWAGVILFFAIGTVIALTVAFRMIDRGSAVIAAIALGSCVGGCGTWFVFYVVFNALKRLRGRRRSDGA